MPYDRVREDTTVDHTEIVCGASLGGIPKSRVDSGEPVSEIFRCQYCKMYWKLSIKDGVPKLEHIESRIPFLRLTSVFNLIDVIGRKIKKGKSWL